MHFNITSSSSLLTTMCYSMNSSFQEPAIVPTISREPTPAESYASHSSMTSPPPSVAALPLRGITNVPADKLPTTKVAAPAAQAPTGDSKGIPINRAGQRIDRRLRQPTTVEQERFEARIKYRKLCNEHHLRHNCYQYNCKYDHDDLDAEMKNTLRYVARRIPCSTGMKCRRGDCYYGHQCPWGNDNCSNVKVRHFDALRNCSAADMITVRLPPKRHARCHRLRDCQIRARCTCLMLGCTTFKARMWFRIGVLLAVCSCQKHRSVVRIRC